MSEISADLYTNLGQSGLKISKVIVGCMSFGLKSWADWVVEDEELVMQVLKKCYDTGIRTFDTADMYSNGTSEVLVGKFLKKYNIPRDKVVILSKCFWHVDGENKYVRGQYPAAEFINRIGLSRKHIVDAVQASVERLGTYIDVLQIHRYDPETPQEETMRALNYVVEQGWTRYIGASSMRCYQFIMYQNIAEKNGWHKFISMQNYYNLTFREEEREMIAYCKKTGVGIIPWSPIARGILARPLGDESSSGRIKSDVGIKLNKLNALSASDQEIINRVEQLAKSRGVSMTTVATAWVLSKDCYPIVGLSKPERVDDLLAAVSLKLTPEEISELETPYIAKAAQELAP
ncbi:unnamed protein product [Kuraishia capsulata CBS 1993]|uniref:NADP-dependent oxidoreductase domain-containing protein n=1 Tax=Kuraishia capsulata CBS 1993 TaxID=1382522 RepID=W6MWL9_9ASCO|nr:uncharacterized protein KUCA_T00003619001 [Kuraishia capsulata CBS 1993]CDK27640.1 unnamed protein product [Kuraishia capsulata CBS 1993]